MKYTCIVFLIFWHTGYGMEEKNIKKQNAIKIAIHKKNTRRKCAYICKECGKQVYEIQRHTRMVHTKERPYECSICKKSFFEAGTCTRHITSQHPDVNNATYIVNFNGKAPYIRTVKNKKNEREKNIKTINQESSQEDSDSIFENSQLIDFLDNEQLALIEKLLKK